MEHKKATVYDIAKAAGVSVATVSRVLNHKDQVSSLTFQKVHSAIKNLGFVQKNDRDNGTALKEKGVSRLLLLNISSMANPFYSEIVRGAKAAANKNGYHLLIDCEPLTALNVDSLINLINDIKISGIIVTDTISNELLSTLQDLIPVVQCSEFNPDALTSYVSINNYAAAKKAVEYILSNNRKRIVLFSTSLRHFYAQKRREGYWDALKGADIIPRDDWSIYVPEIDFELAYQAAKLLFSQSPVPDAIFAVSDVLASAAIKAIHELHLDVPKDVLVVGFDNIDISITTSPTITTVSQPRFQLGYQSIELLLEQLKETNCSLRQTILNTELIIRESS